MKAFIELCGMLLGALFVAFIAGLFVLITALPLLLVARWLFIK